jgi:hypothetical protein
MDPFNGRDYLDVIVDEVMRDGFIELPSEGLEYYHFHRVDFLGTVHIATDNTRYKLRLDAKTRVDLQSNNKACDNASWKPALSLSACSAAGAEVLKNRSKYENALAAVLLLTPLHAAMV